MSVVVVSQALVCQHCARAENDDVGAEAAVQGLDSQSKYSGGWDAVVDAARSSAVTMLLLLLLLPLGNEPRVHVDHDRGTQRPSVCIWLLASTPTQTNPIVQIVALVIVGAVAQ